MKRQNDRQIKGMTFEQIEDLFAARLARILVDQILDNRKSNVIERTNNDQRFETTIKKA